MSVLFYTDKEMNTIRIIQKLDDKIISITQAIQQINKSERTIYRYLKKFRNLWPPWLIHWLKWKPSNNTNSSSLSIKNFVSQKRFKWCWPTYISEIFQDEYWYNVSSETIRQAMITTGIRTVNKRKLIIKHKKRERKSSLWVMIQFDWSYHDWLSNWETMCLLATIDDATSIIPKLMFCKSENLEDIIEFWSQYFKEHWKPESIYLDCHASYKVNHPQDQFDEEMKTRFQSAMSKLWILVIYSKIPQWKWRIERSFKTHQDRLVNDLKLAGISNYEDAQKYIDTVYIHKFNDKFSVKPKEEWDKHIRMTKEELDNLERYFAKEYVRVIKRNWTISFNNNKYQIEKWTILNSKKIIVVESIYWNIKLLSGKILLPFKQLSF